MDTTAPRTSVPHSQVMLGATPDPGSSFTGWNGAGCSRTGNCEVQMPGARSVSAESTAGPTPHTGKPRLSNLKIKPKSKKVRSGKKATFKVKVKNTGNAAAKQLKLCVKGPKKLVKVPKCRKPGKLAPGESKTVNFKVKVKNRAKKGSRRSSPSRPTPKGPRRRAARRR